MLFIPPTIIPSVLTTIMTVAKTVGPFVTKYAPLIIETVGKNLPAIIKTVEAISMVANVTRPGDNVEDIGAKALQADKKPEDFDAFNDYIEYLRNDVVVDKVSLPNDEVDVIARRAIGTSLMLQGLGAKLGQDIPLSFLTAATQAGMAGPVLWQTLNSYRAEGLDSGQLKDYLEDNLPIDESDKHSTLLVNAYQLANPDMTTAQAEDAVMKLS